MEDNLPIDIHHKQLLKWIQSRQKLATDWNKRLVAIQAKATESFQQLPPNVVAQLGGSSEAPLDYYRAVEVRDLLASKADRTLFGGLTGAAATWDKVVKAYEKGGIYLGEAALTLVQNADYEIPYLRKQAAKARQVSEDAVRRQAEYTKSAASCATAYKQECATLGISGDVRKVTQDLQALTHQLPEIFTQALQALQDQRIGDATKYYQEFTSYAHDVVDQTESMLGTLQEVREGRTLPPQELHLQPQQPSTEEPSKAASVAAGGNVSTPGDSQAADTSSSQQQAGGISWDIELPAADEQQQRSPQPAAGISWDIDTQGPQETAETKQEPAVVDISWDIPAPEADTQGAGVVNWDIDVADVGETVEGGAAGGVQWDIDVPEQDAAGSAEQAGTSSNTEDSTVKISNPVIARLVADGEYRAALLDDLLELRAFLQRRRLDLGGSGSGLLGSVMPESLQLTGRENIEAMISSVDAALTILQGPKLAQLLLLSTSPRYLERLVSALQRKAGQEAKMLAAAQEAVAKGNEAKLQIVDISKKVAELVERTRFIKASVEKALSGMFGGRTINILGEINVVLASILA